jgi:hypothetical protein
MVSSCIAIVSIFTFSSYVYTYGTIGCSLIGKDAVALGGGFNPEEFFY